MGLLVRVIPLCDRHRADTHRWTHSLLTVLSETTVELPTKVNVRHYEWNMTKSK